MIKVLSIDDIIKTLASLKADPLYIFYDIETFRYNLEAYKQTKKPTSIKSYPYSVSFSFLDNNLDVNCHVSRDFDTMFYIFLEAFRYKKKKPRIILDAYNGNKYDHHFLNFYLKNERLLPVYNHKLRQATDAANKNSYYPKDIEGGEQNAVFERRVKTKNSLSLTFFIDGMKFETADSYLKATESLRSVGKKLHRLGVLDEKYLKTELDYGKFDLDGNFDSLYSTKNYAMHVFNKLNDDDLTYITNDVIIQAVLYKHFSEIFKGFDFGKMTISGNILDSYATGNDKASYQILHRLYSKDSKYNSINNSEYKFSGRSLFSYIRKAYKGGLNYYNDNFIAKTIEGDLVYLDINSSYPYVMYGNKIPTYLKDFEESENYDIITNVDYSGDTFTIFEVSRRYFDTTLTEAVTSTQLRKMLVKYYSVETDSIFINSTTFKMLEMLTGQKHEKCVCKSFLKYHCEPFAARDELDYYYHIKSQGKSDKKLAYANACDIKVTNEKVKERLTAEEVQTAKLCLNSLYGIPALRSHFNLFRLSESGEYTNFRRCFKNNERNLIFSCFVTSFAIKNLLEPLAIIGQDMIDEHFFYCDTDSLFLSREAYEKLPKKMFDPLELGKWSIECDGVIKLFVLNHKKYCYLDNKNEIKIACAGVRKESFDTDLDFDDFVKQEFSDGRTIQSTRSILNTDGVVVIYDAVIEMDKGGRYPVNASGTIYKKLFDSLDTSITGDMIDYLDSVIYLESPYMAVSISQYLEMNDEKNEDISGLGNLNSYMRWERALTNNYQL